MLGDLVGSKTMGDKSTGRDLKGSSFRLVKVVFWQLSGMSEEKHVKRIRIRLIKISEK